MHALTEITIGDSSSQLSERTISTAALYLAAGLDPTKATLFIQSSVQAHSQLARIIGSITPVGMLTRMVQFKEKSRSRTEGVCLPLLDYPVLMASDILLYGADVVPVGEDQQQHLELTRELALRFNKRFGEVFSTPEPLLATGAERIMSLQDGRKKMSKSDGPDAGRIELLDNPDTIQLKLKRARTDSLNGFEFDNPDRPEINNLLSIYRALTRRTKEEILDECQTLGYGDFKKKLADLIVATLEPIQLNYRSLMADRSELLAVLRCGANSANEIASGTIARASKAIGLATPF